MKYHIIYLMVTILLMPPVVSDSNDRLKERVLANEYALPLSLLVIPCKM